MATSANEVAKEVIKWGSWRDKYRTYYANRLSYDQVKDKNIKNGDICALFTNPDTSLNLEETTPIFSIHWCAHRGIKVAFWDRWYMIFDQPPCNNNEVPLYFLKKNIVSLSSARS